MNAEIILGDARLVLPTMAADSIDCCVTSPPYWGLRDYDVEGQIGLEPDVYMWVREMVTVLDLVKRVLKPSGTLWLNLGDSYAGSRKGGYQGGKSGLQGSLDGPDQSRIAKKTQSRRRDNAAIPRSDLAIRGCKPKDLVGQPWMLAFALREAGWYLRAEIIWHKPNAMPESARDRPTRAHDQVFVFDKDGDSPATLFLLSRKPRYYYDRVAESEPVTGNSHPRGKGVYPKVSGWSEGAGRIHLPVEHSRLRVKQNASYSAAIAKPVDSRNTRSIWSIPTAGYKGNHFATFPRELAARCIKAGCPPGGLVLDPFAGTGTTIAEAVLLGRRGVGIELNPDSVRQARKRIQDHCGLLARE